MRFEKFISAEKIDEELIYKQAKALDDVVLGENTWFFIQPPLLEDTGYYYDVTRGLNESEFEHFAYTKKLLLESQLAEAKDEKEIKKLEKEIKDLTKTVASIEQDPYDARWYQELEELDPKKSKRGGKEASGLKGLAPAAVNAPLSKRMTKDTKRSLDYEKALKKAKKKGVDIPKEFKEKFKEIQSQEKKRQNRPQGPGAGGTQKGLKKKSYEEGVWDAYKSIISKSRTAYHKLEGEVEQKSFITKFIMHGLEKKKGETGWGRVAANGSQTTKELYSDMLDSFKAKQDFVRDVIALYKKEQEEKKEGLKAKLSMAVKYGGNLSKLEAKLENSKDKNIKNQMKKLKELARDDVFKDDEGFQEMLLKIAAKQYKSVAEMTKCAEQWTAIQSNEKTFLSVEISTICPKRRKMLEILQEYRDAKQKVIGAMEAGKPKSVIDKLKKDAEKKKLTPVNNPVCAYCYVENARERGKFLSKKEVDKQTYQGDFAKWIEKDKDGNPVTDDDGNYVVKSAKKKKTDMSPKDKLDALNKMGGLRFFGSGDYVEDKHTDKQIEKIVTDAEMIGLQLKVITKQKSFVQKYGRRTFASGPLKGKPVFNINMSVDEMLGFPLQTAIALKKTFPGNVNIRVVALNPTMAVKYSKVPEVDVITLLHFQDGKRRPSAMKNKDLYVAMNPGTKEWKYAIAQMKKAHPKENWNKVLSKLCCAMDGSGDCRRCPNACGFNPNRVADFVMRAKGGKMNIKTGDMNL